ncbi:MAG: D-tyrosyl-tRNA(Tyr) deacylase [Deltaproteobacteria bacterium]|nr:MAG: D-tyrosyl-tRNA(Tyr) deacylase [Deltaproteobacteria bacterium]
MRTLVQRVDRAHVDVDGETVGAIGRGLLLFVGVERGDTEACARATADKVAELRIFPGIADEGGRARPMDCSVLDVGGACLVVSQFTLAASLRKGRRPSFDAAMPPDRAEPLYLAVARHLEARGLTVATGRFGAHMHVHLVNDGPVTLWIECREGRIL